jgi:hypothetical protein
MAQFNADVFQAIASVSDAKTCANLLCVNTYVSTLKPVFTDLHKVRTNQLFQQLTNILQADYHRMTDRSKQFPITVRTLQMMFNGAYNVEFQYYIHKYFQEVMQNNYSHERVNHSLKKYILETNDYNDEDKNVFEIYSSYLYGTGFSTTLNIETHDEQHEIILAYDIGSSTVELQIFKNESNEALFEDDFALGDSKSLVEKILNICGEFAIAKKPKSVDIDVYTKDTIRSNGVFNMMMSNNDENKLEVLSDIFHHVHLFKYQVDYAILALF